MGIRQNIMSRTIQTKFLFCAFCICLILSILFSTIAFNFTTAAAETNKVSVQNLADNSLLQDEKTYSSLYDLKEYEKVLNTYADKTYEDTIFVAKGQSVYIKAKSITVNNQYIEVIRSSDPTLFRIKVITYKTNNTFRMKITALNGRSMYFRLQADNKEMTSLHAWSGGSYNNNPATWGLDMHIYSDNKTVTADYTKNMSILSQGKVSASNAKKTASGNAVASLTTGFGADGGAIILSNFAFKKVAVSYEAIAGSKITSILTWSGNAATLMYQNASKGDRLFIDITDAFGRNSQLVLVVNT